MNEALTVKKLLEIIANLIIEGRIALTWDLKEPGEETELEKLVKLKPLPKVHYWWPIAHELLTKENGPRLYEIARITHTMCIGRHYTQEEVDRCVKLCAKVNENDPVIRASIGLFASPWHRKFGKDLPPTDRGPTYWEEIQYFEDRLRLVKKWVGQSNQKYQSDLKITSVILDSERFSIKDNDNVWNEGIRECLDVIQLKAKEIFPHARIEWFGRARAPGGPSGWYTYRGFTGREIMESCSPAFYSVPNIDQMRGIYRETCWLADQLGPVEDITPWVGLARGYKPDQHASHKVYHQDWDYDVKYSHQIGAELNNYNNLYPSYNRIKVVVLYPGPFSELTPAWTKHFIAYVQGATGE